MKLKNAIWFCPPPSNIKWQIHPALQYIPCCSYTFQLLSLFFFGQYRPISALFKRCISISKKGKEISPNVESILMCRRFSCVMILITFGLVFYPFHQTNKHGVGFTVVPLCRSLSAVEMPIGSSRIRRHIVRGNVAWGLFCWLSWLLIHCTRD